MSTLQQHRWTDLREPLCALECVCSEEAASALVLSWLYQPVGKDGGEVLSRLNSTLAEAQKRSVAVCNLVEGTCKVAVEKYSSEAGAFDAESDLAAATAAKKAMESLQDVKEVASNIMVTMEWKAGEALHQAEDLLGRAAKLQVAWGVRQLLTRKQVAHPTKGAVVRERLQAMFDRHVLGQPANAECLWEGDLAKMRSILGLDDPDAPSKAPTKRAADGSNQKQNKSRRQGP